jgi:hypothetical protein
VEANSTGGQGSRRAVAPSDDDHDDDNIQMIERQVPCHIYTYTHFVMLTKLRHTTSFVKQDHLRISEIALAHFDLLPDSNSI